jgi:glycosyltransferase 2 family protein
MKRSLLICIKIIIAGVAIYIAFRHVNRDELKHIQWNTTLVWLLPAVIFFNASQFVSTFRLLQYYKLIDAGITYTLNLPLYYTGMFYNLFLPGGIGGDVYKVMVLKKRGNTLVSTSKATLIDRVTGLLTLLAIMSVLLNFRVPLPVNWIRVSSLAVIPAFFLYWFIVRNYFRPFDAVIFKTALLSVIVQICQLVCFFCLLLVVHAPYNDFIQYAILFFAGSVIAALPVSIGGIGTRELTMATGALYLHVSATMAVTASILFYAVTAVSAIAGYTGAKKHLGK